jgi:hypothetical protein
MEEMRTKPCKECFHLNAKQCEAIALSVAIELIQDYEACPCKFCHTEQEEDSNEEEIEWDWHEL